MSQDTIKLLQKENTLRRNRADRKISIEDFHRGMIVLASEYLRADMIEHTLSICSELPQSYYEGKMAEHMDNPVFKEAATYLRDSLRRRVYEQEPLAFRYDGPLLQSYIHDIVGRPGSCFFLQASGGWLQ